MTLWEVLHKLVDAVAYAITTKYLTERWWRWYQARADKRWLERDAERRLMGPEVPQWEGRHLGLDQSDKNLWWPVRLGWKRGGALTFFDRHGWQVGMEGRRRVFGQTIHIGALKIFLGTDGAGRT